MAASGKADRVGATGATINLQHDYCGGLWRGLWAGQEERVHRMRWRL